MVDTIAPLLFFFGAIALGVAVSSIMPYNINIKSPQNPLEISFKDVYSRYNADGDLKEFIMLAKRFSEQHEYVIDEYDCNNYTADFYVLATSLGFKVDKVMGFPDGNGTGHAWIKYETDFDPQTGYFTDYSLEYPNQYLYD